MAVEVEIGEGTCILFFGAVTVAYLVQLAKAYFLEQNIMNPVDKVGRLQGLSATPASISKFLSMWTELGFILLYVWMCERWPAFDHGEKTVSSFVFWLCTLLYMLLAVCTWSFNKSKTNDSLLNREQTEEWKGWMQFMFLAYHYFHQKNVYNAVRCFISCYVWLTGFGNLSFFYTRQDYSVLRLIQMLWRLNFLVFWLCVLLGNTFILYYINPLHTFYFFLSFVTCAVASRLNRETCWALRMKISIVAVLIFAIWEFPDNFNAVWGLFLDRVPRLGAKSGVLHEWHFRTSLDHYSALFGMLFALNYPMTEAWMRRLEDPERTSAFKQWFTKFAVLAVLLGIFVAWIVYIFLTPKFEYNEVHPYFIWVPLITYVFVRNLTPCLRKRHLALLTAMGKITLETYLLQHHVWLAANAKKLLVLIPGYPWVNLAIASIGYLFLSSRLFRITVGLRAMLMPNTLSETLPLCGMLASSIFGVHMVARTLAFTRCGFIAFVASAIVLGVLLALVIHIAISKSMRAGYDPLDDKEGVAVPNPNIRDNNEAETALADSLENSSLSKKAILVRVLLGLYALVVLIGYVYAVFNNPSVVDVSERSPPRPIMEIPENIKESLAGISHDARLGAMVMVLVLVAVVLQDNWLGLGFMSLSCISCSWISHRQAYEALHTKLGATKGIEGGVWKIPAIAICFFIVFCFILTHK